MRGFVRKLIQPWLWKGYRWYLQKKRWYHFEGLAICIYPSVFHPGWLGTTKTFLEFLRPTDFTGKKVLELGAGSGMIALWISRVGGQVMATDINPAAIRSIRESSQRNQLNIEIIHSDLFKAIPNQKFDYLLINPPFYPREANNDRERAFYCGPNFEYFHDLFSQIGDYVHASSKVLMILTDDCDLEAIDQIASKVGQMELLHERKYMGEKHLIYRFRLTQFS